MTPLPPDFFARSALDVARDLLGAVLVHDHPADGRLAGRIVETEAYLQDDAAFRGWGVFDTEAGVVRPEGRALPLFGAPGRAYLYRVYRRHWMFNLVTEPEGRAGAVLLRAAEPLDGLAAMQARRPAARRVPDLANGPGKLTRAFDLDGRFHAQPLDGPPLFLAAAPAPPTHPIATSSRIGLRFGIEHPYRFFLAGHPYVSPGIPGDEAARRRSGGDR